MSRLKFRPLVSVMLVVMMGPCSFVWAGPLSPPERWGAAVVGRGIGDSLGKAAQHALEGAATKAIANVEYNKAREAYFRAPLGTKEREEAGAIFEQMLLEKDAYYLTLALYDFGAGGKRAAALDLITGGKLDGGVPEPARKAFDQWVDAVNVDLNTRLKDRLPLLTPGVFLKAWEATLPSYRRYLDRRNFYEFHRAGKLTQFFPKASHYAVYMLYRGFGDPVSAEDAATHYHTLIDELGEAKVHGVADQLRQAKFSSSGSHAPDPAIGLTHYETMLPLFFDRFGALGAEEKLWSMIAISQSEKIKGHIDYRQPARVAKALYDAYGKDVVLAEVAKIKVLPKQAQLDFRGMQKVKPAGSLGFVDPLYVLRDALLKRSKGAKLPEGPVAVRVLKNLKVLPGTKAINRIDRPIAMHGQWLAYVASPDEVNTPPAVTRGQGRVVSPSYTATDEVVRVMNLKTGKTAWTLSPPESIRELQPRFGLSLAISDSAIAVFATAEESNEDDEIEIWGRVITYSLKTGKVLSEFSAGPVVDKGSRTVIDFPVAIDEKHVLLGAPNRRTDLIRGGAVTFNWSTGMRAEGYLNPEAMKLGWQVALSDQRIAVARKPLSGTNVDALIGVDLYDRRSRKLIKTLRPPEVPFRHLPTGFGESIALDDQLVVVGQSGTERGRAFVYDAKSGEFKGALDPRLPSPILDLGTTPAAEALRGTPGPTDRLGAEVALTPDAILLGGRGAIYLYDRKNLQLRRVLVMSRAGEYSGFGRKIAVHGQQLVVLDALQPDYRHWDEPAVGVPLGLVRLDLSKLSGSDESVVKFAARTWAGDQSKETYAKLKGKVPALIDPHRSRLKQASRKRALEGIEERRRRAAIPGNELAPVLQQAFRQYLKARFVNLATESRERQRGWIQQTIDRLLKAHPEFGDYPDAKLEVYAWELEVKNFERLVANGGGGSREAMYRQNLADAQETLEEVMARRASDPNAGPPDPRIAARATEQAKAEVEAKEAESELLERRRSVLEKANAHFDAYLKAYELAATSDAAVLSRINAERKAVGLKPLAVFDHHRAIVKLSAGFWNQSLAKVATSSSASGVLRDIKSEDADAYQAISETLSFVTKRGSRDALAASLSAVQEKRLAEKSLSADQAFDFASSRDFARALSRLQREQKELWKRELALAKLLQEEGKESSLKRAESRVEAALEKVAKYRKVFEKSETDPVPTVLPGE